MLNFPTNVILLASYHGYKLEFATRCNAALCSQPNLASATGNLRSLSSHPRGGTRNERKERANGRRSARNRRVKVVPRYWKPRPSPHSSSSGSGVTSGVHEYVFIIYEQRLSASTGPASLSTGRHEERQPDNVLRLHIFFPRSTAGN